MWWNSSDIKTFFQSIYILMPLLQFPWWAFYFKNISFTRSSRSLLFCIRLFWEISQNSHQNTCAEKIASFRSANWQIRTPIKIFSSEVCEIFHRAKELFHRALANDCSWTPPGNSSLWKLCSFNFDSVNKKFLLNGTGVTTGYYTASTHRPQAPMFC